MQSTPIPTVEPANWNDALEVVDLEIPEDVVRPAEEVIDLDPFHEPADFAILGDMYAGRVLHASGACRESVNALLTNTNECMFSVELDAYLCALTHLSRRCAAVVMTSFSVADHYARLNPDSRAGMQPLLTSNYVYGEMGSPQLEIVLIPRLLLGGQTSLSESAIGHFTLGVYYPSTGELHHFDSLLNPLGDDDVAFYERVIETLEAPGIPDDQRRFHLRAVHARPSNSINQHPTALAADFGWH